MKTIDPEIARNLIGLQFCGNFGDPMGNPDISKITKYFRENNEKVAIYVKTKNNRSDTSNYRFNKGNRYWNPISKKAIHYRNQN